MPWGFDGAGMPDTCWSKTLEGSVPRSYPPEFRREAPRPRCYGRLAGTLAISGPTTAGGARQLVARRCSSQLWRAATAALLIRAAGAFRSKPWIPPGHTCSSASPPACQIRSV